MLAVLHDLRLEKYIANDAVPPRSVNLTKPTTEEKEVIVKWKSSDVKVQTRIKLAISDSEIVINCISVHTRYNLTMTSSIG
jgi:hypothetical protein